MTFIPRRRITTKEARPIPFLSGRHTLICQLLDPFLSFKYLTIPWLVEFVGGYHTDIRKTLRQMSLEPNNFLYKPEDQLRTINVDAKTFIFALADRGFNELLDRGMAYPHCDYKSKRQHANSRHRAKSFFHECGVDMGFYAPLFYHSMYSEGNFHVLDFATLYQMEYPDLTKSDPDPFPFKLDSNTTMRLDGAPFVIEYDNRHTCFLGIQWDMGTKTNARLEEQLDQAVTLLKRKDLWRWGFDNLMIPFVLMSERRRKHAKDYLEKKYGSVGQILLGLGRDWSVMEHYPKPNDEIIRAPWQRAGYKDFYLSTLSTSKDAEPKSDAL